MAIPLSEAVYVKRVISKGRVLKKEGKLFRAVSKLIRFSGVSGTVRLGCLVETSSLESSIPVVFYLTMTLEQGREFELAKPEFKTYSHIEKNETVAILGWEQYLQLLDGGAI